MARSEMTARPLYQQIARAIASAESARAGGNREAVRRWWRAERLVAEFCTSDTRTHLDSWSTSHTLVLTGGAVRRPDYVVHVTPSLASGFALRIQSRDRSITERLCDFLTEALARMIEDGEAER
jgi:predicted oxidoreductase